MNSRRAPFYLSLLAALITLLVYIPALRNDFVAWDDDVNVYANPHIRSLDPSFLKWAFSDITISYWQPLTWISHALDYAVWGLNPTGHHLTNIILHSLNTFLVVLLIIRLLEEAPLPDRRFILIAAGVAGLLFGIHPLHVESVAWVTERKDLLCTMFFLLSCVAYTKYAQAVRISASDRETAYSGAKSNAGRGLQAFRRKPYLLSLAFFTLALASKPMAVTLPVVLLLLDWYPLGRIRSPKNAIAPLVEKIPFLALGFIASIGAVAHKTPAEVISLAELTITGRILMAAKALIFYLYKMVLPFGLSPYYPDPETVSARSFEYPAAVILVCGITAACIILARKHRMFLAVWGYYIVTLLPVLGIVKTKAVTIADRFTYLPGLGPFLLAGLGAAWLWQRVESLKQFGRAMKWLAPAMALAICILLTHITLRQTAIWKDSITFWSYVIGKEPLRAPVAYNNRGTAFKDKGQLDRAIEDFTKLIAIDKKSPGAYNNRGIVFREAGQLARALDDHTTAIALKPGHPDSYNARGLVYKELGRTDLAIEDFNTAVRLAPDYADAYTSRGWTYKEMGQIGRAMEDYNTAIALDPMRYVAFNNRGMLYQETGRPDLAIEDFTRAVKLNPSFAEGYVNRGLAFEQAGQIDRAIEDYTLAIKANPSFANAYNNRGLLFERTGMLDRALGDLNTAISLNPAGAEAYNNRGLVYEDMGRFELAADDYSSAIRLRPDDPVAYNNRGIVFGKMGDMIRAKKDYQRACDFGSHTACESARKGGSR